MKHEKFYYILSKDYSKIIARISTKGLMELLQVSTRQSLMIHLMIHLMRHPDIDGYPIAEE